MPKSPTELTDLEVDRVDAVDRPATRRKFLITKAEEAPAAAPSASDAASEAMRLLRAATAAIGKIHASKAEYEDQGTVDVLNELAVASGAEVRFAKSAAPVEPAAPAAPAAPEVPAPAAAPAAPVALTAADIPAMAEAMGQAVVKALKADIEKEVGDADATPHIAPASAQPAADPTPVAKRGPVAMGDGVFASILRQ